MMTMAMDCIEKVRYGVTTIEELERVFVLEDQLTEKCPNCERLLNPDFTICPYCNYIISHVCFACGKELDPEWSVCPYCRTEVGMQHRLGPGSPPQPVRPYPHGHTPPPSGTHRIPPPSATSSNLLLPGNTDES